MGTYAREKEKGDLVAQKLTPLYIHVSLSFFLPPPNISFISKGNSLEGEVFNCRFISNHTSSP